MYFGNYFMGKLVMYTGQQPSTNFLPKINTFLVTTRDSCQSTLVKLFACGVSSYIWNRCYKTHSRVACDQECRNSSLENISTHFAMHHIPNCGWVCRYSNRKFRRNYAATHSSWNCMSTFYPCTPQESCTISVANLFTQYKNESV